MQKKRLVIILVSFCVLFSLFQLYTFTHKHPQDIQKTSLIRFQYLMGIHAFLFLGMITILIFDGFYQNAIIAFIFSLVTMITLYICEQNIKRFPGHKQDDDFLVFRENNFKQTQEKTFLSMYYLFYVYSIMGSLLIGVFLVVRYFITCYYQRQLLRQLQTVITYVNYSDQLKDKECSICIAAFMQNIGDDLYQINSCQHVFHGDCIKQWVNYNKTCPLCRASIFPNRRSNHNLTT